MLVLIFGVAAGVGVDVGIWCLVFGCSVGQSGHAPMQAAMAAGAPPPGLPKSKI